MTLKSKPIKKFDSIVHHKIYGKLNIIVSEFNYKTREWEYYCENNLWYPESHLN